MADIREQDLDLKTSISDTDWIRLVTPTGNHRMTVGQFKDLIGYTALQQEINTHLADYAKGTMNRVILRNIANGGDGVTDYTLGEEFVQSVTSDQYGLRVALKNVPINAKVSGIFLPAGSVKFSAPNGNNVDLYFYQRAASVNGFTVGVQPLTSSTHYQWNQITAGIIAVIISW